MTLPGKLYWDEASDQINKQRAAVVSSVREFFNDFVRNLLVYFTGVIRLARAVSFIPKGADGAVAAKRRSGFGSFAAGSAKLREASIERRQVTVREFIGVVEGRRKSDQPLPAGPVSVTCIFQPILPYPFLLDAGLDHDGG